MTPDIGNVPWRLYKSRKCKILHLDFGELPF